MFNTKFLKTLNGSNDSSLYLTCMFSHKHNAHRRPGRLLNVLCTFSLRPVSTGYNPIQAYIPSPYFFRLNKVWSMLHHGPVGRVQNTIKNAHVFHNKICVFIMTYALNAAYLFWRGNLRLFAVLRSKRYSRVVVLKDCTEDLDLYEHVISISSASVYFCNKHTLAWFRGFIC